MCWERAFHDEILGKTQAYLRTSQKLFLAFPHLFFIFFVFFLNYFLLSQPAPPLTALRTHGQQKNWAWWMLSIPYPAGFPPKTTWSLVGLLHPGLLRHSAAFFMLKRSFYGQIEQQNRMKRCGVYFRYLFFTEPLLMMKEQRDLCWFLIFNSALLPVVMMPGSSHFFG